MKQILFFLLLSFPLVVFSQKATLYNKDGISLTYSQTTSKTVFCKKDNKHTYYIRIRYTITNNSNKKAKVTSSVFTPHQPYAGLIRSTCSSQDEIWNATEVTNTSTETILASGNQEFMETVAWYYSTDIGSPTYNINYEFGKPSTSNSNSSASRTLPKTYSTNNQSSGFSVNQAPPRVNPGKAEAEMKKYQQEQNATAERFTAWQNAAKKEQEELQRQKEASNNAKNTQLERQRELERKRNEQNEYLRNKIEQERIINQSEQKAISDAITEAGDIIRQSLRDAEREKEERKRRIAEMVEAENSRSVPSSTPRSFPQDRFTSETYFSEGWKNFKAGDFIKALNNFRLASAHYRDDKSFLYFIGLTQFKNRRISQCD